jgi:hypothetical protein
MPKVLHDIIQAVTGWFDYHLREAAARRKRRQAKLARSSRV